jgi:hypothetical protein
MPDTRSPNFSKHSWPDYDLDCMLACFATRLLVYLNNLQNCITPEIACQKRNKKETKDFSLEIGIQFRRQRRFKVMLIVFK